MTDIPRYRVLKTRYADNAPLTKDGLFNGPPEQRLEAIVSTLQVKQPGQEVEIVEVQGWPPY